MQDWQMRKLSSMVWGRVASFAVFSGPDPVLAGKNKDPDAAKKIPDPASQPWSEVRVTFIVHSRQLKEQQIRSALNKKLSRGRTGGGQDKQSWAKLNLKTLER